jgi:hypothetical protein
VLTPPPPAKRQKTVDVSNEEELQITGSGKTSPKEVIKKESYVNKASYFFS